MFSIPQTLADAARIVLESIKRPTNRTSLIQACVENTEFLPEERANRSPGAPLNRATCLFGNAINFLLKTNRLILEDELISLKEGAPETAGEQANEQNTINLVARDTRIHDLILSIVKADEPNRTDLLEKVCEQYVANYGEIKEDIIRADTGRLLKGMLDGNEIIGDKTKYSLPEVTTNEEKFVKLTSETFMTESVRLLCKICEKHGYEATGTMTDGPQDGGIDGEVVCTDEFGHQEKYILQMKYYTSNKRKTVPETEVREFLGVLSTTPDATKGYFLTNLKYNAATEKLVKRYLYKYIALIDGEKWLALADKIGYRIQNDL